MASGAVAIKPIPAFYSVYVLRSTVRHASLYIGSTPHPPRRLKQHNGDVKGGARRTARAWLRPWEMVALVSGFPSAVAALKFEWALNNAHKTLHIPAEARLTSAARKGSRRPVRTLASTISNVHILTGVASFARWPLSVHFFAADAHAVWQARVQAAAAAAARPGLPVLTDFSGGIHALELDYGDVAPYVDKADGVVAAGREGRCVHCGGRVRAGKGLFPMCPRAGCEAMGHLDCWSRHALVGDEGGDEAVIPRTCDCPACGGTIRWGEMMKELSLRVRGADEVEKLLKRRRRATKKAE